MTVLEKLENFEHDITESWYSNVYIVEEQKYIKAPLVEVEGVRCVKLNCNLYKTKYNKPKKAFLISRKYGLYRY